MARCGGALPAPALARPNAAAGPIARPAPARQEPPARLLSVRAAAAEPPAAAAAHRAATPTPLAAAAATSGVGVVGAEAAPEPPPQLEEVVVHGNTRPRRARPCSTHAHAARRPVDAPEGAQSHPPVIADCSSSRLPPFCHRPARWRRRSAAPMSIGTCHGAGGTVKRASPREHAVASLRARAGRARSVAHAGRARVSAHAP